MGILGIYIGNKLYLYRCRRLNHTRLASQYIHPAIKTSAMYNELELTLSHNGEIWFTNDFDSQLHGEDLGTLEDKISNAIQNDPRFDNDESVKVRLRFDIDVIPKWLHQYHAHYFNYTFTVNNR